jgi:hypothetical protein
MMNMIGFNSKYFKVISLNSRNKYGIYFWNCICYCGKETIKDTAALKRGIPRSCGCYKQLRVGNRYKHEYHTKHGMTKTPLYIVWIGIKARCYNMKNIAYKYYGAKGISVCSEWKNDFLIFMKWCLENGWYKGMNIDRIDPGKNYSPQNCRIVTRSENSRSMHNQKILHNHRQLK